MEAGFEDKLRRAMAEEIQDSVVDEPGNLAFDLRQQIAENFRRYASRYGYDLEEVIAGLRVTDVERRRDGVRLTIQGDHPIGLFEYGADPHRIEGDPLHWVDEATGEDVFATHVDHPGLPEARAFRDALQWLRGRLQARGPGGRFR